MKKPIHQKLYSLALLLKLVWFFQQLGGGGGGGGFFFLKKTHPPQKMFSRSFTGLDINAKEGWISVQFRL